MSETLGLGPLYPPNSKHAAFRVPQLFLAFAGTVVLQHINRTGCFHF